MRSTLAVAGWEFRRYFKWRQQLSGALVSILVFGAWIGVSRLQDRSGGDTTTVAVIAPAAATPLTGTDQLSLTSHAAAEEGELRELVSEGELSGLLLLREAAPAQLVVRRERAWVNDVRELLNGIRRDSVLASENIPPAVLATAFAPAELEVITERGERSRTTATVLIIVLSLMLMALLTGLGYIFASITGEKQIRVTEQVLSAIPAQSWIDGKLLGIAAVSVASVLFMVGAFGIVLLAVHLAGGRIPFSFGGADPMLVLVILVFAVGGLVLWLTFLAAIAAMIDDPHTSTRGSLLLVPVAATGMAFIAIGNPDSALVKTLAILPPTSPSTMPARMILADVSTPEVLLSLLLLAVAAVLLRVAAGRVFRIAMLMYGKEPTWGEVRRWALEK